MRKKTNKRSTQGGRKEIFAVHFFAKFIVIEYLYWRPEINLMENVDDLAAETS